MLTASHVQSLRNGLRRPHLLTFLSDGPWGGSRGPGLTGWQRAFPIHSVAQTMAARTGVEDMAGKGLSVLGGSTAATPERRQLCSSPGDFTSCHPDSLPKPVSPTG